MKSYSDITKTIGQTFWIVVIVPSHAERYLSTSLSEQELAEAQQLTVSTVSDQYLAKFS
jgi:hypothetical protein